MINLEPMPVVPGYSLDLTQVPSPCYVVDREKLEANCRLMADIQERTGCKVILATKSFAMFSLFPVIRKYITGTTASGLYEARLGHEEFGGEVHVYSPAFRENEIDAVLDVADHISFNSLSQWRLFRKRIAAHPRKVSCGLRINPEYSEVEFAIYNPCAAGSRLGIKAGDLSEADLEGIEGLHFHSLCEQNSDALERTLQAVEKKFGHLLHRMKWVNFGGGHHITRPDYDVDLLCSLVNGFKNRYGVQVYLEPGEAVVYHTGWLVATVLDITHNTMPIGILDISATAHTPDVLEMPYRPDIEGADFPGRLGYNYRLGGLTCLAGDVFGDYSFPEPLAIGDKLAFRDMAQYTMVKSTMFNGVPLPSIAIWHPDRQELQMVKSFGYNDYKERLS